MKISCPHCNYQIEFQDSKFLFQLGRILAQLTDAEKDWLIGRILESKQPREKSLAEKVRGILKL